MIYRIKADYENESLSILTGESSLLEAKLIASTLPPKSKPYTLEQVATKEEWDQGAINFCPRCGERLPIP